MKEVTTFFVLVAAVASQAVVHVNFDSQANVFLGSLSGGSGYPPNGGIVTIAGIDHRIAVDTLNRSAGMSSANETKTIPVNVFGVTEVYTIINSFRGVFGQLNGRVEVHGSGGLIETLVLTQGDNIRDHYNGFYNNVATNINGTINYGTGVRFDQQKLVLSAAFQSALLTEVRFIGQNNFGNNGTPMLQSLSLVVPQQSLSGTLDLADTVGSFAVARTIEYSIVQGTITVQTGTIMSSTSSTPFEIALPSGLTGSAVLSFDGSSFLRKSQEITLTGTTNDGGLFSLANGDSDMSGEVDAADIDMVIADFGTTTSNNSDVDVSGEVDAADIDIVIANFGAIDE